MNLLPLLDRYLITVVDGLAYGLVLFVVAAGLTLIWGVADVLNLAHGTLYLVGAYTAWSLSDGGLTGLLLAVAVGAAIGATAGGLLSLAMRPLSRRPFDQALATLGLSFIGADVLTALFSGEPLHVSPPAALAGSVDLAGHAYPAWRLVFIGIAAAVATSLVLTIDRSRAGAVIRAVVTDAPMAEATGIRTRRVQIAVLAAGGAMAVAVGVAAAPVIGPAPGVDHIVLSQSLIIVVVGGLGSMRGALAAAVGVGQVQTLGVLLAPPATAPFLLAAAMLVVLVTRRSTLGRPA
ncbi:branched-chain amino acid ABC transporter permease [Catellatospora sp. NPDC049133]|uniref:branched-chain amino acid ABC transporter permease n=1 Tax=Catellatospora sp. NPDC049133 TaxID=3155499 RepID=UPI0033D94644